MFVSCGIFKEELEYLIREKRLEGNILFLDAALHVNFDKLKAKLNEALKANLRAGEELKVIYGYCHPDIDSILEPFGAKRIAAGNCLEAIVGADEIRKIDSDAKTFFLTSGWVNNWERMFALGKEDLDLDFTKLFVNYKRIVVFDSGVVPIDETKVDKLSLYAHLPVERRKIDLEHLLQVLLSV